MFQKLMVCTDGSPYGDVACQYGFVLAKAFGAKVSGLHVLDIRMIEGPLLADISGAMGATGYFAGLPQFRNLMEAKGEAVCENFRSLAKAAGMEADCAMEMGHPVHVILGQEADQDLLILGQRGENEKFGRELVGSVADRIIRRTTKPCLITHGQFAPLHTVMAACDGSPISETVASLAASVAKAVGASLTVLTVADKLSLDAAQVIADTAGQTCREAGCVPKVVVANGHAAEAILDHIVHEKADMVVMGAHTHTRIRQWFVGCTTQKVLADSGIPALLVR